MNHQRLPIGTCMIYFSICTLYKLYWVIIMASKIKNKKINKNFTELWKEVNWIDQIYCRVCTIASLFLGSLCDITL